MVEEKNVLKERSELDFHHLHRGGIGPIRAGRDIKPFRSGPYHWRADSGRAREVKWN